MTTQRRARNMVEPASTVHLVDRKESISTMSMASKVTHSSMGKRCFKDSHCSKLKIVLNENDTPQNQQFLLVYTLVLPKESRLQKSVDIQG